jgi:DNA-binding Xre family transcriptional regulator
MRVRIPELLEQHGLTPYALSKRSGGRISLSTAYRLNRNRGHAHTFDSTLLEALCDALGVGPGELLERDQAKRAGARRAR